MEFYYDIKGRSDDNWLWPPLWSGRIEASDSKMARTLLKAEYEQEFKRGDNFLLNIKPMSPYLAKRFELVSCPICATEYTANDVYTAGLNDARFCSISCKQENDRRNIGLSSDNVNFYYKNPPVIYMITNLKTSKCYIGKSIRSFTLRWWEHLCAAKAGSDIKFHVALNDSELTDWEFKIVEVIDIKDNKLILEREMYWINMYNSINDGYNSTASLKIENKDQLNILWDETETDATNQSQLQH